jgi:DNA-binding beta-propeller fold protein YncE
MFGYRSTTKHRQLGLFGFVVIATIVLLPTASAQDFRASWGSQGSGQGEFNGPMRDAAVDSEGNAYVTDTGNNRVQKFTDTGQFITEWGSTGLGDGQFRDPHGVAIDGDDFVYVTDSVNNRVQKFTGAGTYVLQWGGAGAGPGQFNWPLGIEVDGAGFVYVADNNNGRIQKFTAAGVYVTEWGVNGLAKGTSLVRFCNVWGIAFIGNTMYATDSCGLVYSFTTSGEVLGSWVIERDDPEGIAVDGAGNIYVTVDDAILIFDENGDLVDEILGFGTDLFCDVSGLVYTSPGFVYVTDGCLHKVTKFIALGNGAPTVSCGEALAIIDLYLLLQQQNEGEEEPPKQAATHLGDLTVLALAVAVVYRRRRR